MYDFDVGAADAYQGTVVTRYLLVILFFATIASRAIGLDFGVAPGLSIKNMMLYVTFSAIAVECVLVRNRKLELLPVILPYGLLVFYAFMTWLIIILLFDNPNYDPQTTLIRLKVKLVDQFLILLVFFYGVVDWKSALWSQKALVWVLILGCLVTVVDSFDIPDLGIITVRASDGRVEGIIGSSQEFGALCAFFIPAIITLWWTSAGLNRFLALVGLGLALVSIMLSASRGAMLGLVASAAIAAIYLRRFISAQMILRATLAVMVVVVGAILLVLSTDFGYLLQTRLSTGISTGGLETLSSGRTAIWAAALREMAASPFSFVTGLGWEAFYQTVGYRYATHSVYLDRLYNLGMIGLTLFAASYVNAIAIARRGLNHVPDQAAPFLMATVAGLVAYMISMAFSDTEGAATYVWASVGLALRVAVTGTGTVNPEPSHQGVGRP